MNSFGPGAEAPDEVLAGYLRQTHESAVARHFARWHMEAPITYIADIKKVVDVADCAIQGGCALLTPAVIPLTALSTGSEQLNGSVRNPRVRHTRRADVLWILQYTQERLPRAPFRETSGTARTLKGVVNPDGIQYGASA
jgi:hypothetical protein